MHIWIPGTTGWHGVASGWICLRLPGLEGAVLALREAGGVCFRVITWATGDDGGPPFTVLETCRSLLVASRPARYAEGDAGPGSLIQRRTYWAERRRRRRRRHSRSVLSTGNSPTCPWIPARLFCTVRYAEQPVGAGPPAPCQIKASPEDAGLAMMPTALGSMSPSHRVRRRSEPGRACSGEGGPRGIRRRWSQPPANPANLGCHRIMPSCGEEARRRGKARAAPSS